MTKIKIEIKSWYNGSVLFEYESEGNTIRQTLQKAVEMDADLRGANLTIIKNDFFLVLLHGIKEIGFLKKAIIDGKIDGSTYSGSCACLSETLEKGAIFQNGKKEKERVKTIMDCRDSGRPAETFFLGIKPGNIPENNQASKLALEWLEEFERLIA